MIATSNQVVSSSLLNISLRFILRSFGLISTLIVARVLVPEDFGIIAFLSITLSFFSILSQVGSQQYIISKLVIDDEDLSTAWTINICFRVLLWILLVTFAPFICKQFDMEIALNGLYFISPILLINALFNPAFWLFKRQLNYKVTFKLEIFTKLLTVIIVLGIVFVYKSYWALLIGDIVSSIVLLMGSYLLHKFRPKFTFSKIKQQWNYSKWIFSKSILGFFNQNIDTLLVTKLFNSFELGGFHLTKQISSLPVSELLAPGTEPLLASFSKVQSNPEKVIEQFTISFIVIFSFAFPISIFLFLFSETIVSTLLGNQWIGFSEVFGSFSLVMFGLGFMPLLNNFLIIKNKLKEIFIFNVLTVALFLFLVATISIDSLVQITFLKGSTQCLVLIAMLYYLDKNYNIGLIKLLKLVAPIVICTLISAIIANNLPSFQSVYIEFIVLTGTYFLLLISLIAIAYVFALNQSQEYKTIYNFLIQYKRNS